MTVPGHHINHKVADDDKGSTDGTDISDYEPDVAEAALPPAESSDIEVGDMDLKEDTGTSYAATKAMGDADREVSLLISANITCNLDFD